MRPDGEDATIDLTATSTGLGHALAPAGVMPERVGDYRLIRLIGTGGMAWVYEAEQEHPRRRVALKIMRAGLLEAEMQRRFHLETQLLARLQHPGIAQIYQAGMADIAGVPQPYFAMELVEGSTLLRYVEDHRLPARARLQLFAGICEAIHYAHQRGIIHRDLKPGNILVSRETGQPKILDFGVARLTDADVQATMYTAVGQVIGTVPYMSPEQIAGDPREIDVRSDVYALGVILYELLAGQRPYQLDGMSLFEAARIIRENEPTSLGTVHRAFRGDLDTIVRKALEKDPARRYASAAQLAADIVCHLDDRPIVARPPSTSYQLRKFARRNKALVAGIASTFVVLTLGATVSTREALRARRAEAVAADRLVETDRARMVADWQRLEAEQATSRADQERRLAEANYERAEQMRRRAERGERENRRLLYLSEMSLADAAWRSGNYGRTLELLERHRPTSGQPDLRSIEWLLFSHIVNRSEFVVRDRSWINTMALSPDGGSFATAGGGAHIVVRDAVRGTVIRELKRGIASAQVFALAFSPDGTRLAVPVRNTVVVLGALDGAVHASFDFGTLVADVKFLGSRDLLYARDNDATSKVWSVAEGRQVAIFEKARIQAGGSTLALLRGSALSRWTPAGEAALAASVRVAAVSPDGTQVVGASADGMIQRWDAMTLKPLSQFRTDRRVLGVKISRNGQFLVGVVDGGFAVWDLTKGSEISFLRHDGVPSDPALSDDGARIAASNQDGIHVFDVLQRRRIGVINARDSTSRALFLPDGNLITSGSQSARRWLWTRIAPAEAPPFPPGMVQAFDVAPDGHLAAAILGSGGIHLWDPAANRPPVVLAPGTTVAGAAFLAGGRRLLAADTSQSLTVWDVGAARRLREAALEGSGQTLCLRASPDGRHAALCRDDSVQLWSAEAARVRTFTLGGSARSVAFSSDGQRLAAAGLHRELRVWEVSSGRLLAAINRPHEGWMAVAFSHDGRLLAAGDQKGTLVIWSTATFREVATLPAAHAASIKAIAFSPDGRRIVTAGLDGGPRIWDVDTLQPVADLIHPGATDTRVWDMRLTADGLLVGASGVSLWRFADRR